MTYRTLALLLAFSPLALILPAHADTLVGSSVTGTLSFGAPGGTNYYDPANGFVPPHDGYENSSISYNSSTVPISDSFPEFGAISSQNVYISEFTATGLIFDVVQVNSGTYSSVFLTFTDPAFAGLTLTELDSNFSSTPAYSLSGDTITISVPSFTAAQPDSSSHVEFSLTSAQTPEPSSFALLGTGIAALATRLRRRNPRPVARS